MAKDKATKTGVIDVPMNVDRETKGKWMFSLPLISNNTLLGNAIVYVDKMAFPARPAGVSLSIAIVKDE